MRACLLLAVILFGTSLHAAAQQSAIIQPVGALNNQIVITGQIAGGERRHAYKFTVAERACVRLDRVRTSVSLRAFLYDDRRGLIQQRRWDDPNRISRYVTQTMEQTLFPGDYVLEVELFYSRDTAAVYDLLIARC